MLSFRKASIKRGKPNYLYSIVGISLVLLVMGIMGWLFLNFHSTGNLFKEDIKIQVFMKTSNRDSILQIKRYVESQPYAKGVQYVTKDMARKIWNKDNNEDWANILDENPLPESVDFFAKAKYVNADSLGKITTGITTLYGGQISEIKYPRDLVNNINEKASKFGLASLVISLVLCIIVMFSIDNTIRLVMFSNRFLIKTMQMVGATRQFITKPMIIRAIFNGLVGAALAIIIMAILIEWSEQQIPQLQLIHDTLSDIILYLLMLIFGVGISVFSTYRSVGKYLRTKVEDLY